MKCAAAVMRSRLGRSVRRLSQTVNHTGPSGLKNEITYVDEFFCSRYTFVECPAQIGSGWGVGCCAEGYHLPPRTRSQRREPMMIPEAPPLIRYSSRFGHSSVKSETTLLRGLEARRSM